MNFNNIGFFYGLVICLSVEKKKKQFITLNYVRFRSNKNCGIPLMASLP